MVPINISGIQQSSKYFHIFPYSRMRWVSLSFSSYLTFNKSPGVAKLHRLICFFRNDFATDIKKQTNKKITQNTKLLNLPRFLDSLQKKKKRPSLWHHSAIPCCSLRSISLIHRILLSSPKNFVGSSLLLSLLWSLHSLVSFLIIFFMVSGRTQDNLHCHPHHLGLEPLSHTPAVSSSSPFDQYLSQLSTGISEKKNTTLEIVRSNTIHFLCTRKKNYQAWGTYDPKAGTGLLMYQALFQALYIHWLIQSLQWHKNSLKFSPLYRWGNLRHRKVN